MLLCVPFVSDCVHTLSGGRTATVLQQLCMRQRKVENPDIFIDQYICLQLSRGLDSVFTPFRKPHNKWRAHVSAGPDKPPKPRGGRGKREERDREKHAHSQAVHINTDRVTSSFRPDGIRFTRRTSATGQASQAGVAAILKLQCHHAIPGLFVDQEMSFP